MELWGKFWEAFEENLELPLVFLKDLANRGILACILAGVAFVIVTRVMCEIWDKRLFGTHKKGTLNYYSAYACRLLAGFVLHVAFYTIVDVVMTDLTEINPNSNWLPILGVGYFATALIMLGYVWKTRRELKGYNDNYNDFELY